MANIQQSLNQMLYTGTVAAGLYAHSPAGQTQAKIRGLERNIKVYNKAIESHTASSTEYQKRAEAASQLYELDPSQERSDIQEQYTGEREKLFPSKPIQTDKEKLTNAINSLTSRLDEKNGQKQGLKERVQLLDQYGKPIGGNNNG
jgi:chromosome segregation ATPase